VGLRHQTLGINSGSGLRQAIRIFHTTLETCAQAEGVVVVVDVLRAFTTSAVAFHRGAQEIVLVSTVEEAFQLRQQYPEILLMGEIDGYPVEGFDLSNSPAEIDELDLNNRCMALRTTAGTQGIVRATQARHLYAASLCNANATASSIAALNPAFVTFVNTGVRAKGGGEEDIACSDYIASLLQQRALGPSEIRQRVLESKAAAKFTPGDDSGFSRADLEQALQFNRFPFAMKVTGTERGLTLRPYQ
jgi:2-phosphosulfolactate phosphatase